MLRTEFKKIGELMTGDRVAVPNPDGSPGMCEARVIGVSDRGNPTFVFMVEPDTSFEMWESV